MGKKNKTRNSAAGVKSAIRSMLPHSYNPRNAPPTNKEEPWAARRALINLTPGTDTKISVIDIINSLKPKVTSGTVAINAEIRILRISVYLYRETNQAPNGDFVSLHPFDPVNGGSFAPMKERATTTNNGTLGFDYGITIGSVPLTPLDATVAIANGSEFYCDCLFRILSLSGAALLEEIIPPPREGSFLPIKDGPDEDQQDPCDFLAKARRDPCELF